jgi:hypothetical protein
LAADSWALEQPVSGCVRVLDWRRALQIAAWVSSKPANAKIPAKAELNIRFGWGLMPAGD